MKKILIFADGVTTAHVTRMEQLARQLDQNQFEIHLAAPEKYFSLLSIQKDLNTTLHSISSVATDDFNRRLYQTEFPWTADELSRQAKEDLELVQKVKPDLIVGDTRLDLIVVAQKLKIPYYNVVSFYWSPTYPRPQLVPHVAVVDAVGRGLSQIFSPLVTPFILSMQKKKMNAWLKEWGVSPLQSIFDFYSQGDYLLFPDPEEFFAGFPCPENAAFIGPLIWNSPLTQWPSAWTDFKKSQTSFAFVSMGSSGNTKLFPKLVQSLIDLKFEVLAVGPESVTRELKRPGVHVASFLPMDRVFKTCSLVIGNGGTGTTYPGIQEAAHTFHIPTNMDQYLNLHRLREMHLTDYLDISRFTQARFTAQVDAFIHDAEVKKQIEKMKTVLNQSMSQDRLNPFLMQTISR